VCGWAGDTLGCDAIAEADSGVCRLSKDSLEQDAQRLGRPLQPELTWVLTRLDPLPQLPISGMRFYLDAGAAGS
jgi:hypothetical protein